MIKNKLYSIKKKIYRYYQQYKFDPSDYWEKHGGRIYYDAFHSNDGERNEDKFLDHIQKHKPKRIIDIGCGYGRYLKAIRNQFSDIELYGSDISSTQIAYAKKYLSNDNINLLISDSTKFDFQNNFFDLSIGYSLWEHIPPKIFNTVYNEISRISKKGYFLEFDRTSNNKMALKNKHNHVFENNLETNFKNHLISKTPVQGSWGEILYHLDFENDKI